MFDFESLDVYKRALTFIILTTTILIAVAIFSLQTFAGAPTTSIIVNGPGIPPQGIVITGTWPGGTSFMDSKSTPVSEPASDVPRYVLVGSADENHLWYTVLYAWDHHFGQALVYLPGPSDLGYQVNYRVDTSYEKRAGKWYYVSNRKWADMIRKVLPQTGQGTNAKH